MEIMIIASVIILIAVLFIAFQGLKHTQPADSALRQRAVFNSYQLVMFNRLKEMMPHAHILAHVSFDALLTTKLPRTRRKFESMFADFVILDKEAKVLAIVNLEDKFSIKRGNSTVLKNLMLENAGYKVINYQNIPDYHQLRNDFLSDFTEQMQHYYHEKIESDQNLADALSLEKSATQMKLMKYKAEQLEDMRAFG